MLTTSLVHGQERWFSYIEGWNAYGALESGDSIIVNGISQDDQSSNQVQLTILDPSGSLIQEIEYSSDTTEFLEFRQTSSLIKTPSGFNMVAFMQGQESGINYGLFRKLDADLSITADQSYQLADDQTFFYSIHPASESNEYYIISAINTLASTPHSGVTLVDSDGTVLEHHEFFSGAPWEDWLLPWHVLPTPDGGYLFTAREYIGPGGSGVDDEHHATLIKVDSIGQEEWRMRPGDPEHWSEPGWPVLLDDGTVYFCWVDTYTIESSVDNPNLDSNVHFAIINLDIGEVVNSGNYIDNVPTYNSEPDTGHFYFLYQSQILSDGNILISGYDVHRAFLLKVNQNGQYIWHRAILNPNQNGEELDTFGRFHVRGLTECEDRGLLCAGEFRVDPDGEIFPGGIQTAFAMKLDSLGCLEPGCHLVDNLEEQGSPAPLGVLQLYPNPAENFVTLDYRIQNQRIVNGQLHYSLVDAQGKQVLSAALVNTEDQVLISTSGMQSGAYTLYLFSGAKTIAERALIVQ